MRVIWIDPGETVGWVTANVNPAVLRQDTGPSLQVTANVNPAVLRQDTGPSLQVLDYGNTKLKRFALALLDGAYKYDVIGYEAYYIDPSKLRAHAGSDVPTLQLVGMIRLAAWHAQKHRGPIMIKLVEQNRNDKSLGQGAAKLHLPDHVDVINEALEGRHDDGHYGDALLHLAAWYHKSYGADQH